MSEIKFNYAEVENYCNEMYKLLDELKNVDESFKSSIKKIRSGSIWKGKASDGFVRRCEKTANVCDVMEEALKNAILFVIECSENYSSSESSIMNRIKSDLR